MSSSSVAVSLSASNEEEGGRREEGGGRREEGGGRREEGGGRREDQEYNPKNVEEEEELKSDQGTVVLRTNMDVGKLLKENLKNCKLCLS